MESCIWRARNITLEEEEQGNLSTWWKKMVSSHMVIYAAESSLKRFIPLFVMLLLIEVEAFMWPDSMLCTAVFGFFICKAVGAHWWKLCGLLLAGVMGAHLVADFADGSSNVHEVWKFFFK